MGYCLCCYAAPDQVTAKPVFRPLAEAVDQCELLDEFYKKGCQEKSFSLDRTARRFLSRDPAHCL
jgi:hypothetical protein